MLLKRHTTGGGGAPTAHSTRSSVARQGGRASTLGNKKEGWIHLLCRQMCKMGGYKLFALEAAYSLAGCTLLHCAITQPTPLPRLLTPRQDFMVRFGTGTAAVLQCHRIYKMRTTSDSHAAARHVAHRKDWQRFLAQQLANPSWLSQTLRWLCWNSVTASPFQCSIRRSRDVMLSPALDWRVVLYGTLQSFVGTVSLEPGPYVNLITGPNGMRPPGVVVPCGHGPCSQRRTLDCSCLCF